MPGEPIKLRFDLGKAFCQSCYGAEYEETIVIWGQQKMLKVSVFQMADAT